MDDINAWLFNIELALASGWKLYTFLALFSYGVYQYLLEYSVDKHARIIDRSIVIKLMLASGSMTLVICSSIYLIYISLQGVVLNNIGYGIVLGILQGILFFFANKFRFEATRYYPISMVLPVTKLSILIVIIMSWIWFDEFDSVTGNSLVGFILIGLAIYLFKEEDEKKENTFADEEERRLSKFRASIYLVSATLASAAIALLSKYAVGPVKIDIFMFIFISNYVLVIVAIFLLVPQLKKIKSDIINSSVQPDANIGATIISTVRRGMLLGIFNLIAFACLLHALTLNDASIVIPIYSLYIVIPVILGAIINGDFLTSKTTVAVILSIAAIIVLG